MFSKDEKILEQLVKLGLSQDAGKCYLSLLKSGSLSSARLAQKINVLPNAIYRLTQKLTKLELIVSLDTYPQKFQAIPLPIAIESLTANRIKELEKIKIDINNTFAEKSNPNPQTKIDILTGKNNLMNKYVNLAKNTNNEILIISIGEPVPDEVKLANRDALEKGVKIKFLIHQYDKNNLNLINSWVRMGLEVRYYQDSGYHLQIFDNNTTILSVNNPQNTDERTSIIIYSSNLSQALKNYFYTLWEKALPIKA